MKRRKMPIEVSDIVPTPTPPESAAAEEAAPEEEEGVPEATPEAAPAPKRRGRPPGSKNKPKEREVLAQEAAKLPREALAPAAFALYGV